MYERLATFHSEMYFSIQVERQPSSEEVSEEPGEGMHLSKQCSLTFCTREDTTVRIMQPGINTD